MSIGCFVDGSYVYKIFRGKIDYCKLRNFIEQDLKDKIDEGYYFNADENPPRAEKLHNFLTFPPPTGPGFRVKIYWLHKKLLFWPPNLGGHPVTHPDDQNLQYELTTQKAVDVGLIYHMTRSYHKRGWNKLVVGAGDADFYEPIQNLVEVENVDLFLLGSLSSMSEKLRPYARKIYEIDKEPLHTQLRYIETH